ncbi:MAG: hypothetical protein ACO3NR_07200 [Rhodothermales bacterium]
MQVSTPVGLLKTRREETSAKSSDGLVLYKIGDVTASTGDE